MLKYLYISVIILICTQISYAHKITVFAWVEGNSIHIESKFNGGRKVNKGDVSAINKAGDIIHKGKTNSKGEYTFTIKEKSPLKIWVDAGNGHKGYWDITQGEFDGSDIEPSHNIEPVQKNMTSEKKYESNEIREIVDSVVSSRLKPIQRELALLRKSKEPGFQDIAGGVGYIFGLMGIFLYFKYGRKE
ncbi:MAG: hypothetical protein GY714_20700 [Desulfobacterales bacterium]|nr:hypothetical protein [Desulfobacterales bacterium]MCP4160594.1 hypothetical protein [Deltaproteobacteria bacterium]